jgi:MFS transporter, PAT family, beta-lactamase induction signal transducer AmpG
MRRLPPWAMGLALTPLGFYYGYISTAIPILLSARGNSVGSIAGIQATAFSPTFWAFALCPILEVRFSRRTYAFLFAMLSAVCLAASTLLVGQLGVFTAVVTFGCVSTVLFGSAVSGWLADVIKDRDYNQVGAFSNIANLGAAGVFSALSVVLIRRVSADSAALLLATILLIPTSLLLFIPVPPRAIRAASEAFRTLYRDVVYACRRPGFLIGMVCFLSPTACFALTNIFSSLGRDFGVSEKWVTSINGPSVAAFCSLGCLAGIWLCHRYRRQTVYVLAGLGGAMAAGGLMVSPHTLVYYAAGVVVYNFFQGINYAAFGALQFEIVGPGNPLAATQMALLSAALNVPITYMTAVDGHFHTTHGLNGMLLVDAGSSVAMGTVLLLVFRGISRGKPTASSNREAVVIDGI